MIDFQSLTQLVSVPAAHGDAATYVVAFLSSTAVELVAVACLISAFALGGVSQLLRGGGDHDRRRTGRFQFDVLSLSKLIIPVTCLIMTVWIYLATQTA